jgi:hypothetical protein
MKVNLTAIILVLFSVEAFSGAWGTGSFENDTASDWVYEIENTRGSEVLLSAIREVFKTDYKDADVCTNAIAAAEVIASIKDGDSNNLPESLVKWVASNKSIYEPEMAKFALKALEACKSTANSELAQLWSEGDSSGWDAQINKLELRLKAKRITKLSN